MRRFLSLFCLLLTCTVASASDTILYLVLEKSSITDQEITYFKDCLKRSYKDPMLTPDFRDSPDPAYYYLSLKVEEGDQKVIDAITERKAGYVYLKATREEDGSVLFENVAEKPVFKGVEKSTP